MWLNLLHNSNNITINSKIAHCMGLEIAVYIGAIFTCEFDGFGTAHLNRLEILDKTTLGESVQKDIEKKLYKLGIISDISCDNEDVVTFDFDKLVLCCVEEDTILKDKVKKITEIKNVKSRMTKDEAIQNNLRKYIRTDNPELRDAYIKWINAVCNKLGWMDSSTVELTQDYIDNFSAKDLDVALDILRIATMNGYRDISFAINMYSDRKFNNRVTVNYTNFNNSQKLDYDKVYD